MTAEGFGVRVLLTAFIFLAIEIIDANMSSWALWWVWSLLISLAIVFGGFLIIDGGDSDESSGDWI